MSGLMDALRKELLAELGTQKSAHGKLESELRSARLELAEAKKAHKSLKESETLATRVRSLELDISDLYKHVLMDGTGLLDWALESIGGRIIGHRTSPRLQRAPSRDPPGKPVVSEVEGGFPKNWEKIREKSEKNQETFDKNQEKNKKNYEKNYKKPTPNNIHENTQINTNKPIGKAPEVVLQPNTNPGQCFAFKGAKGVISIKLPAVLNLTHISVDHVLPSLTSTSWTAPKKFSVLLISPDNLDSVLQDRPLSPVSEEPGPSLVSWLSSWIRYGSDEEEHFEKNEKKLETNDQHLEQRYQNSQKNENFQNSAQNFKKKAENFKNNAKNSPKTAQHFEKENESVKAETFKTENVETENVKTGKYEGNITNEQNMKMKDENLTGDKKREYSKPNETKDNSKQKDLSADINDSDIFNDFNNPLIDTKAVHAGTFTFIYPPEERSDKMKSRNDSEEQANDQSHRITTKTWQTFELPTKLPPAKAVQFIFHSNYGGAYTCVYRLRAHGNKLDG